MIVGLIYISFLLLIVVAGAWIAKLRAKISASELERERYFREIHHRVSNHLQILSSLANLEMNGLKDGAEGRALRSTQARICCLGMLYELSRKNGSNKISLLDYVSRAYEKHKDLPPVFAFSGLGGNAKDLALELREIVPLALILNEVLGVCWRQIMPGSFSVSLEQGNSKLNLELVTAPAIEWNWNSLQQEIIRNLGKQFQAEITTTAGHFKVNWPLPNAPS